ncbi:MAG TPA: purine-binding chemotaxis protein CheW [Clostridiales bacterium]|jgi:two-component system chemotaxis response regulator CheV|nr:purine-binding chemotaxis protein CheW [Clostridiales bacterium]
MEAMNLEILEFSAGGHSYGINIGNIREILPYDKTPVPVYGAHPFIEGLIMPRDYLIPIIDVVKILNLKDIEDHKEEMLIVTTYQNIGIHVDRVVGIYRVSSEDILSPGKDLTTSNKQAISGILKIDDRTIEILDIETILRDINPDIKFA